MGTKDNPQVCYHACFVNGDRNYTWKTFKTYGGARRFISNSGLLRRFDGWFIERVKSWTDDFGLYGCSGVIIAQQKDIVVKNHFRTIA